MNARKMIVLFVCVILTGSLFLNPQLSAAASTIKNDPSISTPQPEEENPSSSDKKFDKKDLPRVKDYLATHEKKNLEPVMLNGQPVPETALVPTYSIQPILFIASDLAENPQNAAAIAGTFQLLNRWYSGALEQRSSGYSYQLANVIVYHAPQPFSYFKCPNHEAVCDNYDGIWGNVQIELMNAGYPIWAAGTSYVVFVKGAGGWAGSNSSNPTTNWPAPGPASQAGFGILGDWALDAITGTTNEECYANLGSACYRDPQRGAVGHELGHTFGLAHAQDQTGSIMFSWWDFPYDSLFGTPDNDEKSVLRNGSPFFQPQACNPAVQVDQVSSPTSVISGTRFTVSFKLTNYGFCHWSASNTVLQLVSTNVWRASKQPLNVDIYPAQPVQFSPVLTAPTFRGTAPVTYDDYWQMMAGKKYFGPKIGGKITVTK